MRRETQNVVLVLLGGALLKIALTGMYLRYVKPALQPWLVCAGAVIVGLAAVSIVVDIRQRGAAPARPSPRPGPADDAATTGAGHPVPAVEHAPADGHDHGHGSSKSPWLLLLPVLAIVLIAPPALGADSVNRSGGRTLADQQRSSTMFKPIPVGNTPLLSMSDFSTRVVWDKSGTLNGRVIRLSGFVVKDRQTGQNLVARLVITCCAADAMPVKARLVGDPATQDSVSALKPDEWVEVTGQAVPHSGRTSDDYVPSFTVSAVREIPVPADPYEY